MMSAADHIILQAYKRHLRDQLQQYMHLQLRNNTLTHHGIHPVQQLLDFLCNILHNELAEEETISLIQIKKIIDAPIKFVSLIGSIGVAKEIYGEQLPHVLLLAKQAVQVELRAKKMETLLFLFNEDTSLHQYPTALTKDIPLAETQDYFQDLSLLLTQMQDRDLVANTINILLDIKQHTRRINNLGRADVWAIKRTTQLLQGLSNLPCMADATQLQEILGILAANQSWFYRLQADSGE